jgi:hypothetical protein
MRVLLEEGEMRIPTHDIVEFATWEQVAAYDDKTGIEMVPEEPREGEMSEDNGAIIVEPGETISWQMEMVALPPEDFISGMVIPLREIRGANTGTFTRIFDKITEDTNWEKVLKEHAVCCLSSPPLKVWGLQESLSSSDLNKNFKILMDILAKHSIACGDDAQPTTDTMTTVKGMIGTLSKDDQQMLYRWMHDALNCRRYD